MNPIAEAFFRIALGFIGGAASVGGAKLWKVFKVRKHAKKLCGVFHVYKDGTRLTSETVTITSGSWGELIMISEDSPHGKWRSKIQLDESFPFVGNGVFQYNPPNGGSGIHRIQFNPTDGTIAVNAQNTSNPEKFPVSTGYTLKRVCD